MIEESKDDSIASEIMGGSDDEMLHAAVRPLVLWYLLAEKVAELQ